jgi:DNA-directed RNA polymerase specialized sigma24 family protein
VREVFTALWFRRVKYSEPEEVKLFVFTMARTVAVKYLRKALEKVSKNRE